VHCKHLEVYLPTNSIEVGDVDFDLVVVEVAVDVQVVLLYFLLGNAGEGD
jgi:hypothetical protein